MTAIPAYVKTWTQKLTTGVPGARIPYVSLIDLAQNYAYGVKAFLVAGGCSVVWSASGGTGPANSADHTDRITSAATWTPRATVAGASQAWVVLLDGNGGHLLLSYTGGSDDVFYVAYSPTAAFVLAGTTNQRPTAIDEIPMNTGVTMVGTNTSADRVWHGLITSDAKNYRFCIARSGVLLGQIWGVDAFTVTTAIGAGVSIPLAVTAYGFASTSWEAASTFFTTGSANNAFRTRVVISSVAFTTVCGVSSYNINGQSVGFVSYQPEIQGASSGYIPFPCFLFGSTASARGFLGTFIDFHTSAASAGVSGDGFGGTYEWWHLGYGLWPNPSNIAPVLT